MGKFEKRFLTMLEQDKINPADEAKAMASTLETETQPEDLGADVDSAAMQAIAQREQQMLGKVNEWIAKLADFTEYLNGTGPSSMLTVLNRAEPETLLDKIKTTETKRITRTAAELASLEQTLKGYLGTASNPKYKYV